MYFHVHVYTCSIPLNLSVLNLLVDVSSVYETGERMAGGEKEILYKISINGTL